MLEQRGVVAPLEPPEPPLPVLPVSDESELFAQLVTYRAQIIITTFHVDFIFFLLRENRILGQLAGICRIVTSISKQSTKLRRHEVGG